MTGDLDFALSDVELDLLDKHGIDIDRVLGVLHAVLIAPGMIPPSRWLPLAFADVPPEPEAIQLLLRLYNQVGDLLRGGRVFIAEADDEAACAAFASGYAAGAALDPSWIGDADRWTFASPLAYLGERRDLISPELLAEYDAEPERRQVLLRDLDRIVITTYSAFAKYRVPTARPTSQARPGAAGVGRKYKRCCLGQT